MNYKSNQLKSKIVSLDHTDIFTINDTTNNMLKRARNDILFSISDSTYTPEQLNDRVFFYQLFINDALYGICYAFYDDNTLNYTILLENTSNLQAEPIIKSYIGYFIQHIIKNTDKRLTEKKKPVLTFQFDLSEQYSILDDYSFLTEDPYRLYDYKHAGKNVKLLNYTL